MSGNAMEQLMVIWSPDNPLFPVHRQHAQYINSISIYECGVMLFLGGGVSCVFFLLPDSLSLRELMCFYAFGVVILKNIASLNPPMALLSQRVSFFKGGLYPSLNPPWPYSRSEYCSLREGCTRELTQQLLAASVWIGEGSIAYDRSTA